MAKPKPEATQPDLSELLMKPRAAIAASLQAGVMLPGGGGTATTLSQHKQPGIKLIHMPGHGLFIQYKNKNAFTPDANLKEAWYEDEAKPV